MAEAAPICPTVEYSDWKKDPEHFVEIRLDIKGLEKKRFGKPNAEIAFEKSERSFVISVEPNPLKGTSKLNRYRYEVKRLPADIDPKKSNFEVRTDEVVVYLRKATPGSWARYLSSVGLEFDDNAS